MSVLIHELLSASARLHGSKLAVVGPKEELSYQELDAKSDALARALVASGVAPGDPVGLAIHKCADAIIAVYGILKSGACYVPIDPFAPAQRSAAIVANTAMSVIVTTADRVTSLVAKLMDEEPCSLKTAFVPGAFSGDVPTGLVVTDWSGPADVPLPAITDTHLAYVLHTSGSTGLPKGVAITHHNALTFVEMATAAFEVVPEDRLCSQAPLHFDLSVFDLFVACQAGACVVLIPEFYAAFPKKMASAIEKHGITIWNSVVSTLTLMMERGKPDTICFDSLRAVIFSGEVMAVRYLRELGTHMKNASFYNVYGQTEANSSLFYKIDDKELAKDAAWKIPLGKAFPNFEVFVLDGDGNEVTAAGIEGELYVRSSSVAAGYWGKPEMTAERFVSDPRSAGVGARVYRTGDLVRLDAEGNVLFAGRTDDMIKSRGYRVELGDIDLALLACSNIESAAAVAVPDEEVGNRIFAFITISGDCSDDDPVTAVLAQLRERLPKYMIPEKVMVRSDMPRTSTGKIDRKLLRAEVV